MNERDALHIVTDAAACFDEAAKPQTESESESESESKRAYTRMHCGTIKKAKRWSAGLWPLWLCFCLRRVDGQASGGGRVHARAFGRCATYRLRVRMRVVGSRRRSPRRGAEPSQTEIMAEMTTEEHRPHTHAQSYIEAHIRRV